MPPVVFALPGNESMAEPAARGPRRGERIIGDAQFFGRRNLPAVRNGPQGPERGISVCTLDRPDDKALRLLFAADAARDLGASAWAS